MDRRRESDLRLRGAWWAYSSGPAPTPGWPEPAPWLPPTPAGSKVFGQHELGTLRQLRRVAGRAVKVALMADGQEGRRVPNGCVAAYKDEVSVGGVGFDIGCGNTAIRTDLELGANLDLPALADEISAAFTFDTHAPSRAPDSLRDHELFRSAAWEHVPVQHRDALREASRERIGTVGGGNHYVDVFADELERIWVAVHFGSGSLGHAVAGGFLSLADGRAWDEEPPEDDAVLSLDSRLGRGYWQMMQLAGEYAAAGRRWVARRTVELMGGRELELIDVHHNFAWREEHFGEDLVVVRKSATPCLPGEAGFVGGSMGDDAVILQGAHHLSEDQRSALFSTVHGAGRAARYPGTPARPGRPVTTATLGGAPPVTREMMLEWIKRKNVELRGGSVQEAPQAYRRLAEVLAAQGDTIEVLHTLKPLIVVMAG